MPKLSVIIACYNIEAYVEQAVRSVMEQTMQDLEIICVNDASTDSTPAILEALQEEDPRIRVIHHEKNQGLLAVRCHGVEAATGEYCAFLDGDDYLSTDIFQAAVDLAEAEKVDLVQFETDIFPKDSLSPDHYEILKKTITPCSSALPKGRGALLNECFHNRKISWNVWGKIYKTENVKKATAFYNGEYLIMAEDLLLSFMILLFTDGYRPLNRIGCHYRQGSGVTKADETFSLRKMTLYAQEYQAYSLLCDWTARLDLSDRVSLALADVHSLVFSDSEHAFLKCDPEIKGKAVDAFLQYWNPCDVLRLLFTNNDFRFPMNVAELGETAWSLRNCESLQALPNAEVKTIGMFYYRAYNGGVERVLSLLSEQFCSAGYRVVLITEEKPNPLDYPLPDEVVRVVIPSAGSQRESLDQRFQVWLETIQKYHIDVMIYHAWVNNRLIEDQIAIKMARIPFILYGHGSATCNAFFGDPTAVFQTVSQKRLYCLCDLIVTLSAVDRTWWEMLGFRTVSVCNPLTFPPLPLAEIQPTKSRSILWIGRISPEKQPTEAVKIMRYVHEQVPDAKLLMLGMSQMPTYFDHLRSLIRENGLEESVLLEGQQTHVEDYLKNACAVLWTSSMEGAPMGIAESKCYGVPIVAYDLPNVDMIRDGKGVFAVRQGDAEGAAAALVRLLNDSDYQHDMALSARQSVDSYFAVSLSERWKTFFAKAFEAREPEVLGSACGLAETAVSLATQNFRAGMIKLFPEFQTASFKTDVLQAELLLESPEKPEADLPVEPPAPNKFVWFCKKAFKAFLPAGFVELREGWKAQRCGLSKRLRKTLKAICPYGILRLWQKIKYHY